MSELASTSATVPSRPGIAADRIRWAALAAFAILGFGLVWHFAAILKFSVWAIRYPYELDYGEGIVWQQLRLILAGEGYRQDSGFEAVANNYPPVYYIFTAAVAALNGGDPLAAGRTVSLASLLAAALFGGGIVQRLLLAEAGRLAATLCACVAALLMLCNWPVLFWTPLMRVDMLGLALSFAGTYFVILALQRPGFIYAAAIAFLMAVYTKQTMIAAPAASFLILFWLRPRTAIAGVGTCIALGLGVLVACSWITEGGFLRDIFGANVNRINAGQLLSIPLQMILHAVFLGVAGLAVKVRLSLLLGEVRAAGGFRAARERIAGDPGKATSLILLVYLALASLMLLTIAKSGANLNYMIEWFCVLTLFIGVSIKDAAMMLRRPDAHPVKGAAPAIIAVAALSAQVLVLPTERFERISPLAKRAEMEQLSAMVRAASKPVVSDDMVLLLRSGKEVLVEPGMVAELGALGLYDQRPYLRKIRNGDFAFFVTFRERGEPTFDSRYSPVLADAIDAAYPVKRQLAGLTLHLPAR